MPFVWPEEWEEGLLQPPERIFEFFRTAINESEVDMKHKAENFQQVYKRNPTH